MARQRDRTVFLCQECGDTTTRWEGRCPHCGVWNALQEYLVPSSGPTHDWLSPGTPRELTSIQAQDANHRALSSAEMNRVLGGGLVPGSLVLLAGDPGIGKSTLLLQTMGSWAREAPPVLYISGEESVEQVKLRAERLQVPGDGLYVLAETSMGTILENLESLRPTLAVVDSVQTITSAENPGEPGSVTQVRGSTRRLLQWAKARQTPVILAGHVTKEGTVAGPRVLEHLVDVVLSLEGDSLTTFRLLRGVKNRFGSTNEVGVFEMRAEGLIDVSEPSQALLAGRQADAIGSAVGAVVEGARPLLVEVQGLTAGTVFSSPRRTCNGVDFQRLLLLVAVLTRRLGIPLGSVDVMVNVVGGIKIEEPATDLGVALAIVSSVRDVPLKRATVAIGEIGLGGEIRRVPQLRRRVVEAARLGFDRILVPHLQQDEVIDLKDCAVVPVSDLRTAIGEALDDTPGRRRENLGLVGSQPVDGGKG